jgi:hypothetical protein
VRTLLKKQTAGRAKCRAPRYHTFAHQAADSGLIDKLI